MPKIKKTWAAWHHLAIEMVTSDGVPVRAILHGIDGVVGVSFPDGDGWSECPGTSPNVPLVLKRIAEDIRPNV